MHKTYTHILPILALSLSAHIGAQTVNYTATVTNTSDAVLDLNAPSTGTFSNFVFIGTTGNTTMHGSPFVNGIIEGNSVVGDTLTNGSISYQYTFDSLLDGGSLDLTYALQRGDWTVSISGGNGTLSEGTAITFVHGTTTGQEGTDFVHDNLSPSSYFFDDKSSFLGNNNLGFYGSLDITGTYNTVTFTQLYSPDSQGNSHDTGVALDLNNFTVVPSTVLQTVTGSINDQEIRSNGTVNWIGQTSMRVGGAASGRDGAGCYIFTLPAIPSGESVSSASLSFTLNSIANSPTGSIDLYALDSRSAATVTYADYYQGAYSGDPMATAIQDDILTLSTLPGRITSDALASNNLADFLNQQYAAGAQAGDFVVLRLNTDVADESDYFFFDVASANSAGNAPELTISTAPSGNGNGNGNGNGPNPEQRFNLYGATDVPSFPMTSDRTWPSAIGDADLCLWNDDKFASLSITIQDNIAADQPWWSFVSTLYGLDLTWFGITSEVGSPGGYYGGWSDFQALVNAGNSVQSHAMTRNNSQGYATEYSQSQTEINNNLSGQSCLTLAYPSPSTITPRPDLAANTYIGGRGTFGTPNVANQIDYMQTNSCTVGARKDYVDSVAYGFSGIGWLGSNNYRRGWLCVHYHSVPNRPAVEADMAYVHTLSNIDRLWVGTFDDVIRFVQERDTATLNVTGVQANQISFNLTDWMDDSIYDFPLTVKVRISNTWGTVQAQQGSIARDAQIVTHAGNKYALVKAVPDAGEVILTP